MNGRSGLILLGLLSLSSCLPDPGRWVFENLEKNNNYVGLTKNAYSGSSIYITVKCTDLKEKNKIKVGWLLRRTPCWEEYLALDTDGGQYYKGYYQNPDENPYAPSSFFNQTVPHVKEENSYNCDDVIIIPNVPPKEAPATEAPIKQKRDRLRREAANDTTKKQDEEEANHVAHGPLSTNEPQYTLIKDGVYLIVVYVGNQDTLQDQRFTASVTVEVKSGRGYLSITDWPLLPFYGCMCAVYVAMGIAWLCVSSMHWRDILRIQFWIGGVIFLGMLEKAMFYAEYQNINSNGVSTQGLILAAEIVSCGKRTLARMLVIIVSLGFGIVKPRLGPTLQRVVGIGGLYFILAVIESVLRVIHPKNDPSGKTLLAAVPLAVIDSSICWWVFSALVQTTRTLRLRRNNVKLSLYKHFANTLVFAVLASIIFMLWSIKFHKLVDCLTDWRDLWVDEAFWHLLFSTILLVIMVLWRPSQNNQRYAFTPLLDGEEDYSSDEEDTLYNDAWDGMKMRGQKAPRPDTPSGADPEEDPLKWVEENIPEGDGPLPIIDSEEEIETTKMEISKMQ